MQASPIEKQRERILVVDDDPSICELFIDVLAHKGFAATCFTDPHEALDSAEAGSYDLAFVDIYLPDISGWQLAAKIKKASPRTMIVFITGHGTFEDAVEAIRIGACDYLRKPFGVGELTMTLQRIQEQTLLRDRAQAAEQHYMHLVQNIPIIIFTLNSDLNLEFINESVTGILGYPPPEALNQEEFLIQAMHPDDREHVRDMLTESFGKGSPFSVECRFLHKNGRVIHTILKIMPRSILCEDNVCTLEGVIMDITERVMLEKAVILDEKLKTLGAISAEVAHEIRNPLMCIGGFANRLSRSNPDIREAGIILGETKRLESLLNRITGYLEPVSITHQECQINDLISESVNMLLATLDDKQVDYHLELDPDLPPVPVDPEILKQVFIHLIRNALQNTPDHGRLDVTSTDGSGSVQVVLESSVAPGSDVDGERIFMPFDKGGQSIGLPLSYRHIKNMGGLLTFSSEDGRAVFTITLPKVQDLTGGQQLQPGDQDRGDDGLQGRCRAD
jgi:PAS domain S-box-containing protein